MKDVAKDENELEAADTFESSFNFRYEEEGGSKIVSYARDVQGSLRRKDDKRKQQREARKAKKERERREREEEVKRLKVRLAGDVLCTVMCSHSQLEQKMKLQELQSQMEQVKDAAGADLPMAPEDMDADFDPEEHDRRMAAMFDDDYYEGEEEDAGEKGWEAGEGKRPTWAAVDDVLPEEAKGAASGGAVASEAAPSSDTGGKPVAMPTDLEIEEVTCRCCVVAACRAQADMPKCRRRFSQSTTSRTWSAE